MTDDTAVYVFGEYELDMRVKELRRAGVGVHVEPQVFDVIAFLVAHRDRLVTRDELLDSIWGHRFIETTTLSTRIKQARQAVGDDGSRQRVIRTVRGRGFRFVADVEGPGTASRAPGADGNVRIFRNPEDRRNPAASESDSAGGGVASHAVPVQTTSAGAGVQRIRLCTADDGVRIAYASSGSGPVLVKTANWLTHLEHDWDSPVWRHWLRELSREHTLVRYDERGCGLSDRDVDDLSFDAWVRDLDTVVEQAGVERFPLIGISQGCAVAVAWAARNPDRVSKLILYGGFVQGRLRRAQSDAERAEADALIRVMPLGWGRDNPAFRQFFSTLFLPDGTTEQMHWFTDLQQSTTTPGNAIRLRTTSAGIDVTDAATTVRAPTLVLHATGDAAVPFEQGRTFAALIPGARLVPLESRNHILLEDEPAWDRFREEVRAFLAS